MCSSTCSSKQLNAHGAGGSGGGRRAIKHPGPCRLSCIRIAAKR